MLGECGGPVGDKVQNYAWLAGWWEQFKDRPAAMACAPNKLIKLIAFKPKTNAIDQNKLEPNPDRLREVCRKEKADGPCGTIDEVIAAHERQGLKILAQGYEMLRYPDNRYTTGSLITVMGTEGYAPRMVWLISYSGATTGAGATRVLYDVAPKS
jgi:hypothetical protein